MKKSGTGQGQSASELISKRIAELGDWRGETLSRMRQLIREADPDVVEEWKWMGTPIFSHDGIICTGESYKQVVKLTFAKGASLADPAGLFNSSLDGNVRRAIDIREGEEIDEADFKALVRQAVALNSASNSKARTKAAPASTSAKSKPAKIAKPTKSKAAPSTRPTVKSAKPMAKSAKPTAKSAKPTAKSAKPTKPKTVKSTKATAKSAKS